MTPPTVEPSGGSGSGSGSGAGKRIGSGHNAGRYGGPSENDGCRESLGSRSKQDLRRHQRRVRQRSLAGALPGLQAQARRWLPPLLPAGLRLGLYWPIGSEPDLAPLAPDGLREVLAGRLALPAVLPTAADGGSDHLRPIPERAVAEAQATPSTPDQGGAEPVAPGAGETLLYLPWNGQPPLARDACGIPAPLPSGPVRPLAPQELGLLLVPALAIDRRGVRLGSGGGWYDRLRADPAWRAIPALAVLPRACLVDSLPRDPWDIPFDGWLDETGLTWLAPAAQR